MKLWCLSGFLPTLWDDLWSTIVQKTITPKSCPCSELAVGRGVAHTPQILGSPFFEQDQRAAPSGSGSLGSFRSQFWIILGIGSSGPGFLLHREAMDGWHHRMMTELGPCHHPEIWTNQKWLPKITPGFPRENMVACYLGTFSQELGAFYSKALLLVVFGPANPFPILSSFDPSVLVNGQVVFLAIDIINADRIFTFPIICF